METIKTIYDIAKEAGVSASTVSRVVNHKPGIKEETRKRVAELLEKYQYIPNEAARGLVTQASRIIGILIEDIRVSHHTESAYVIEQEMTRRGYTCITLSTGTDPKRKADYIRILEQRRVEGVILMGSMFGTDEVKESLVKHLPNVPTVLVNGWLDLPGVYSVIADEERGLEQCVELLAGKGRKKIAYVQDQDTPANRSKLRGYKNGMNRLGIPEEEQLVYYAHTGSEKDLDPERTMNLGYEVTERILDQAPWTEGIIYSVDLLAVGGVRALSSRKISVPDQIAVIGVDNTLYGKICTPQLTTLDNRLVEVSRNASRVLLAALEGKTSARQLLLLTEIVQRETT